MSVTISIYPVSGASASAGFISLIGGGVAICHCSCDASQAGPPALETKARSAPSRRRFFVPAAICSMAAGFGHPSGWPVLGPVLATHCQPSPIQPPADGDGFQTTKESNTMAHATPGAIRPKSHTFTELAIAFAGHVTIALTFFYALLGMAGGVA